MNDTIHTLLTEVQDVLTGNILPFWLNKMQDPEGGFYGQMQGDGTIVKDAPRGGILNARILWAMSAAYRVLGKPEYLAAATHAKDYILAHFIDREHGGTYWSLCADGTPLDTKKQFYAIGFTIYGLSEYARATGDKEALQEAINLYHAIEDHAWDDVYGGYIEAQTRDWQTIADMRLSDKDENTEKSQNTHLHIIEPYTNLYRVWPDAELKQKISRLIRVFDDKIRQSNNHLGLFFPMNWQVTSAAYSAGHDIEASWLIDEAAAVIGEHHDDFVRALAEASKEGLLDNGLMHGTWWEQAETIVGFTNLYQHFGDEDALAIADRCWQAVKAHYIDYEHGEWYWGADNCNPAEDKAGFWKCPYHNSRMCLEIIERFR